MNKYVMKQYNDSSRVDGMQKSELRRYIYFYSNFVFILIGAKPIANNNKTHSTKSVILHMQMDNAIFSFSLSLPISRNFFCFSSSRFEECILVKLAGRD